MHKEEYEVNYELDIKKNLLKGPSKLDLYNLKNDPKELNNIANKNPEIINRMERLLKQAHTKASVEKFNMPYLDE